MAYFDTSVLIAYYWPEPLSAAAEAEILRVRVPAVSTLTKVEFRSALGIKLRTGSIGLDEARRVLSAFQSQCTSGMYRILPIEARAYDVASEWLAAFATPLRTLDALHLATAFSNSLTVVTADKDLAASAKYFSVKYKLIH